VLCQHLCRAAVHASTLSFWESEVPSTALVLQVTLVTKNSTRQTSSLEPLKHLCLDPQNVTKLAVKLYAHLVQSYLPSILILLFAPDALLRKLLQRVAI